MLPLDFPKCVFCDVPTVDGSVFLQDVDVEKLKKWWLNGTGDEIDEESVVGKHCCMNCVREARLLHNYTGDSDDCIWWPTDDPLYKYYEKGYMTSCSVQLTKLSDEEILYHAKMSDVEIKTEPPSSPYNTKQYSPLDQMPNSYSPPKKKKKSNESVVPDELCTSPLDIPVPEAPDTVVCFYCQEKGPRGTFFDKHMGSKICGSCNKSFPCEGQLCKHRSMCEPKKAPLEATSLLQDLFVEEPLEPKKVTKKSNSPASSKFWCIFCSEDFKLKTNFDEHMGKVHEKSTSSVFKCGECDKNLIGIIPLQSHLQENHNFEISLAFQLIGDTGDGIATVLPVDAVLVKCEVCEKLVSKSLLEMHTNKYHPVEQVRKTPLNCHHCEFITEDDAILRDHHIKEHPDENQYKCKFCNTTFRFKTLYLYHVCHKKPKVSCQECCLDMYEEFMVTHLQVEGHMKKGCLNPPKCQTLKKAHELSSIYCTLCKVKACTVEDLMLHTLKDHGEAYVSLLHGLKYKRLGNICDKCNIYFPCESSLESHLETCHVNPNLHACRFCGQLMGSLENLKFHFTSVHQLKYRGYHCAKCNSYFFLKHIYLRHKERNKCQPPVVQTAREKHISSLSRKRKARTTVSTYAEMLLQCVSCKLRYSTSERLNEHMLVVHNTFLPHDCMICGKNFKRTDEMQQHILFGHLLDPEFTEETAAELAPNKETAKCNLCFESVHQEDMRNHLNVNHRNELITGLAAKASDDKKHPRYECEFCDMVFSRKQRVPLHFAESHLENPLTVCIYCRKYCKKWENVVTHIKSVHVNSSEAKIVCYHCKSQIDPADTVPHYRTHEEPEKIKQAQLKKKPALIANGTSNTFDFMRVKDFSTIDAEVNPAKDLDSDIVTVFSDSSDEDYDETPEETFQVIDLPQDEVVQDITEALMQWRKCTICHELVLPGEMVHHMDNRHSVTLDDDDEDDDNVKKPLTLSIHARAAPEENGEAPPKNKKVLCAHCGLQILACNLRRHIKLIHTEVKLEKRKRKSAEDKKVNCHVCGEKILKTAVAMHYMNKHPKVKKAKAKISSKPVERVACKICGKWLHPHSMSRHILFAHKSQPLRLTASEIVQLQFVNTESNKDPPSDKVFVKPDEDELDLF